MITFRRKLLDQFLEDSIPLMQGVVIDIGGYKLGKRGQFRPPMHKVESWTYLNSDPKTQPDLCCSAQKIPLADNTVDTILCCEVMEYLETPGEVLSEMYRILKPEGIAIITIPFLHPIHGDNLADRQRWTALGYQELCKQFGFKKIKIQEMGSLGSVLWDLFHVSLGYGCDAPKSLLNKILRKVLHFVTPFFLWLDSQCTTQRKYITSGYFIKLCK